MLITVLIIKISIDFRWCFSQSLIYSCFERYFHFSVGVSISCCMVFYTASSIDKQCLSTALHKMSCTQPFCQSSQHWQAYNVIWKKSIFWGVTKILSSCHTLKTPFPTLSLFGSATLIHQLHSLKEMLKDCIGCTT